jgi:hypothetical protein
MEIHYLKACQDIFGKINAEKWLDENSDKLSFDAKDVNSAKKEIYNIINKTEVK